MVYRPLVYGIIIMIVRAFEPWYTWWTNVFEIKINYWKLTKPLIKTQIQLLHRYSSNRS